MKGKAKLLAITLVISILIPFFVISAKTNVTADAGDVYYRNVLITHGDSLWSLAEQYKPEDAPIRQYIRAVMDLNGLKSDTIYEGQYIILPVR